MGKNIGVNSVYGQFDKQVLTPNGTTISFDLLYRVGSANSIFVVYNGAVLEPGIDYTLDGGGTIMTSFAPANASRLYVIFLGKELAVPRAPGSYPVYYTAVGDGSTTEFTLPLSPIVHSALIIFNDRLLSRHDEEWEISGDTVTFSVAPANNALLDFYIHGIERSDIISVDALTITSSKIVPGAVTADKLNLFYTPYTPVLQTFGGMTLSNTTIHLAEWMDTGYGIKVRLHFTTTPTGGDNKIRFSLPANNDGSSNVPGNVTLSTDSYIESGIIRWGAVDYLDIYRQFGINYTNEEWTAEVILEYKNA